MNSKGFTTVEVLVCFVIISVVMMSLFSTISAFNEKKVQESYRSRVYEFKNEITKKVQEDLIRRGLTYAKIKDNGLPPGDINGKTYTVDLTFKDGTSKQLIVHQRFTRTAYRIEGCPTQDDEFYIEYGPENDKVRYDLPNLGENSGYYNTTTGSYIPAEVDGRCFAGINHSGGEKTCLVSKDFQINNIFISITNEADPEAESHVLNIYIGFYHPNLGSKYAINIVAPVDYQSSSVDQVNEFPKTASDPNSTTAIYYP